jgi:hypothetical protein
LLAIAEGGVGDKELFRWAHGHMAVVEGYLGHLGIVVEEAIELRLLNILKGVFILGLFKSAALFTEL